MLCDKNVRHTRTKSTPTPTPTEDGYKLNGFTAWTITKKKDTPSTMIRVHATISTHTIKEKIVTILLTFFFIFSDEKPETT